MASIYPMAALFNFYLEQSSDSISVSLKLHRSYNKNTHNFEIAPRE